MSALPVIVDTDPGVDDAIALFLGFASPELDILAITTTAGNVGLDSTTRNALLLRDMVGSDVPVYRGASAPILAELADAAEVHGSGGLGRYTFGAVPGTEAPGHAWDALYDIARARKDVTIVALGPLTNVAIALLRHPDLPRYVSRIVSMGGGVGYGNRKPYSEFNYWFDPLAAKIAMNSPIEFRMVGLNATRQTTLDDAEMAALGSSVPRIDEFIKMQGEYYVERLRSRGLANGFHIPDAVAMAAAIDPRVVEFECCPVEMVCDESPRRGWSIVDLRGRKTGGRKIHVAMKADKELFKALLHRMHGMKASGGRA